MKLVTTYVSPDLDGVACTVGLAELLRAKGEDVQAGIFGELWQEARWVIEAFRMPSVPDGSSFLSETDEITIVDVSSINDIKQVMPIGKITEMIDHHEISCDSDLPNLSKKQIEIVGSCATLIAERMRATDHAPSRDAARLLSGAIVSNTVNFRSGVTTERDTRAFEWLGPFAELPDDFVLRMFQEKSNLKGDRLAHALENDLVPKEFVGKKFVVFQLEIAGVHELLQTRKDEVIEIMRRASAARQGQYFFLNALDILGATTTIFTPDAESAEVVSAALNREFNDGVSVVDGLFMRKQIMPLIKTFLEKQQGAPEHGTP